jgi:hypothetical protein
MAWLSDAIQVNKNYQMSSQATMLMHTWTHSGVTDEDVSILTELSCSLVEV